MSVTLPHKLRVALYVITIVGSPVMAYLLSKGIIGDLELTLWAAEVTAVGTIAALNVSKPE